MTSGRYKHWRSSVWPTQRSASTARTSAVFPSGSMSPPGHPVWMVDKSKEYTTTSGRAIAQDGAIACELLVGGVHTEFGLLNTGDQHMVMLKQVLQFCVAVLNAIAIELQKPTSLKGRSWSSSSRLSRWAGSNGMGPLGEGVPGTRWSNVFAPCLRTLPLWWVQRGGPGWSMWSGSTLLAAGSLLWNGDIKMCANSRRRQLQAATADYKKRVYIYIYTHRFALVGGSRTGGYQRWTESRWFWWTMASFFPICPLDQGCTEFNIYIYIYIYIYWN